MINGSGAHLAPGPFKDWNFTHFNQILEEAGVFYLRDAVTIRWDEKISFGTRIFESIDIHPQRIDPEIFKVGGHPLKKIILE